jgi:hypothetical protein
MGVGERSWFHSDVILGVYFEIASPACLLGVRLAQKCEVSPSLRHSSLSDRATTSLSLASGIMVRPPFSGWWQSKGNALQGVEREGVAEQKQVLDVH